MFKTHRQSPLCKWMCSPPVCVWKVDLLDTHGSVVLYEYVMTHLSTPDRANNPPPPCVWHYILLCFCADPLIHLSWGTDADCDLLLAAMTSQPPSRKRSIIYAQIGPILMLLFGRQLPKIAAAIAIVPLWNRWCYTWACVCQILQSRLQVNASESLQFLTHPTFQSCLCQPVSMSQFSVKRSLTCFMGLI